MPITDRVSQLRKGVLELAILAVLSHDEGYASEIIDRLAAYPGLAPSAGTVYPLLARLSKAGFVHTRWGESPNGPPRKYYRLSPTGHASLTEGAATWTELSQAMSELLTKETK